MLHDHKSLEKILKCRAEDNKVNNQSIRAQVILNEHTVHKGNQNIFLIQGSLFF